MNFPSRDLTNQYISLSYQDVLQQYIAAPTSYVLDGYGNVLFSFPSSSTGGSIVITNSSGSSYVSQSLLFNTTPATPPNQEGQVWWDSENHTLAIKPDITSSTLQVGQETWLRYVAGEDITNGNAIYITSLFDADGHPVCKKAIADGSRTKYGVVAVATNDAISGSHNLATISGVVNDLDTSMYPAGSPIFLSETIAGGYRIGPPDEPHERVLIGYITYQNVTQGSLYVGIVGVPDAYRAFVGITEVPSISTSSMSSSGSIVSIGTGSVSLCTTADGTGVVRNYQLNSASFALTSSFLDVQYIIAKYNGGSPQYDLVTDRNTVDSIQTTLVYTLLLGAGGRVSYVSWDAPGILLSNKENLRVQTLRGIERESGLQLSYSGSRYVTITNGVVWQGIKQISLAPVTSSVDRLVLIAHSASVFSGSTITQYVNDVYDNGTNLIPLSNNHYVNNWVYRAIGNLNSTLIQLSTQYAKPEDAISANPPTPPIELKDVAILVGRAIYKKGIDVPYQIDSAFTTDYFGGISIHNNLIGLQGGTTNEYYHLTSTQHSAISSLATYRTITGSNAILTSDYIIYASASTSNIILTMPSAASVPGQVFKIKKIDSTGYEIIISSSVNVDYDPELRLNQRGSSVTLHSDAMQYWIH